MIQIGDNQMDFIGVYDFNSGAILIEIIVNEYPDKIDYMGFYVQDSATDKSNW